MCIHYIILKSLITLYRIIVITDWALRSSQSSSRNVRMFMYMFICPLAMQFPPTWPFWAKLVQQSGCPYVVCCPLPMQFFLGLSLALRSNDQFQAYHCKDQVKFSKLNSDLSNLIFVSFHKLLKTYSPSVLFKDGLKLYVFESLKLRAKF